MTTYIWHSDYYYFACMTETIEEARALVKEKFPNDISFDYESEVIIKPGDCVRIEHMNQ